VDRSESRRRLKELAAALKAEPGSIPRRLELAAALRDAGRAADAIDLYGGVAEAYAEEGRLVQAMAVCKGILEIDPDHRRTLEMLANLAQRRAARKGSATLRQIDGRWVAEPTHDDERTDEEPDERDRTPASIGDVLPVREVTPLGPPMGADHSWPDDPARRSWLDDPGSQPWSIDTGMSLADSPMVDTDVSTVPPGIDDPSPLDFPDETKRHARGDRLLDFVAPELPITDQVTAPTPRVAEDELPVADEPTMDERHRVTQPHAMPPPVSERVTQPRAVVIPDEARRPTDTRPPLSGTDILADENLEEQTRAGTLRALEAGIPPAAAHGPPPTVLEGTLPRGGRREVDLLPPNAHAPVLTELVFDDEESSAGGFINDVLSGPFPRPELLVEPPPFPLLSDLPRLAFMELLARLAVVRLDANVNVLREGELGDACYLIAAGSVRVTKRGVEVAVLGPGSFFGEFAVLADQRRHASVETIEPVELLEIRRGLLDELVAAHPGVARTLRKFYRERLLSTLLATAPFFSRLTAEERVKVAERFRPRRFGRGTHIIDEGQPGGGLYLILVGEVAVVRGSGDEELTLGKLGEGSYFGEMSLLRGGVASATVRAARMTEVVQLPPRDFYEVVSQHPVLWEQLRSEAERRELANHAIVAGEARKSDDDNIYLV
jgi:CRP-like cAMP-binding protein